MSVTFNQREFRRKRLKSRFTLFITAVVQVLLVVMSTVFIASKWIPGIAFTGFFISLVWTFNVKRAAFGDIYDRFIYAFGALAGTMIGFYFSNYLIS